MRTNWPGPPSGFIERPKIPTTWDKQREFTVKLTSTHQSILDGMTNALVLW